MNSFFEKMEFCAAGVSLREEAAFAQTVALLADDDWRVRLAAAVALGDRGDQGDPRAADALIAALRRENEAPLFTQPKLEMSLPAGSNIPAEITFPQGTAESTKEAWRRRGRVIQAACLALGGIGAATPAALELLHDYATNQKRDYAVRVAACKALGMLARPESLPALEKAAGDEEWCTSTEARKAIALVKSGNAA